MVGQRHRLAEWGSVMVGIEALIIQRVPNLVQQREQSLGKVARMVSDGDADVPRPDRSADWVSADIEPPALEVEPQRRRDALEEQALSVDRKLAREDVRRRGRGHAAERIDQRHQRVLELREECRHTSSR